MAKIKEKLNAIKLRKKGWSIKEIAESLNISKGSASVWCSDTELTLKQKEKLHKKMVDAGHVGRVRGAEVNRQKKLKRLSFYRNKAKKELINFTKRDLAMLGLGLYWGEGTKSNKSSLAFVNSDPDAILITYKYFHSIFGVKKEDFMPRIFINDIHKPRIKKVLQYWSSLLELPIEQFGNPVFLRMKNKKRYDNHESYFGIISLKVRKSSELKYQIIGLIEELKSKNK